MISRNINTKNNEQSQIEQSKYINGKTGYENRI